MEESLISTLNPIFMAFTVLLKVKLKAGSNGPARKNIKVQKSLNGFGWGPPIPIYYDKVGTGFYFFSSKDSLRMQNQVPGQKYFPLIQRFPRLSGECIPHEGKHLLLTSLQDSNGKVQSKL